MNYGLIIKMSVFGLIMGIGTVYFIPSDIEPVFWLIIFGICAYLIAKHTEGKHFLHGFLTSLANCVWITGSHVLLFAEYASRHPEEMTQMAQWEAMANHPRVMMLIVGPIVGIVSGIVLGLFAVVAGKLVKKG